MNNWWILQKNWYFFYIIRYPSEDMDHTINGSHKHDRENEMKRQRTRYHGIYFYLLFNRCNLFYPFYLYLCFQKSRRVYFELPLQVATWQNWKAKEILLAWFQNVWILRWNVIDENNEHTHLWCKNAKKNNAVLKFQ